MTVLDPGSPPRDDGEAIHLGPERAHRRLVLLHGWGADADDLLDLGVALLQGGDLEAAPVDRDGAGAASLVALRAPEPHPYGSGRQWYGLQPIDWAALPAARAALRRRLEQLAASVPLERTVLLGFSQGGAMAIDVGTGLPLAGIVACSGYPHEGWHPGADLPPVLLSHGLQDPVVPYEASRDLQRRLAQAGARVELLPFEGGHGIDPDLLPQLAAFVRRCLAGAA